MTVLKNWRVLLLGAAASLAAVYVIARQLDVHALAAAFEQARYVYVIPTLALVVAGLVCRAVRWRVLLSDGLPLARAFNILNVAYFVNGVLPFRVGEVARAYLATRADPPVPMFKSASTIIVERLLDLIAVLVILALGAAVALPDELRGAAVVFTPIVLIGFLALVLLAAQRKLAFRILDAAKVRLPVLERLNVEAWLRHFLDGLLPLTQPAALFRALLWTGVSWGFSLASGYVLMLAFFDQADWAAVCLFTAAASFAVAVPAVPGNLGTYELSILLGLGARGYSSPIETATAFAVMVHAVNLSMNALLGVYGLVQEGITLGQLSQGVRGQAIRAGQPLSAQGENQEVNG